MTLSISRRLALMFAGSGLVVFALFTIVLHFFLQRELERHQRTELTTRVEFNERLIARSIDTTRWETVRAKLDALSPPDGSIRFWILGPDPRYTYGAELKTVAGSFASDGYGELKVTDLERPMKTLGHTIAASGERPAVRFVVAIDQTPYRDTLQAFTIALVAASLVGVLLVAGLGHWIARIALRPVERLSRQAQTLSPRQLSQRLHNADLPPELSELAASFNGALDRLESAWQQLEGFNADVAHELRTPLTNLIGQTQVALSRERGAQELLEVLQSNLEELDRLRGIINDMLFLARADQGETARDRVVVSLAQEVRKTAEFLEFVVDEAGVSLQVSGDASAGIERALFGRAVANLLQNAVQHSRQGDVIAVEISSAAAGVRVAVHNPGPAIAAEHLQRLFDRFYRVDTARAGSRDNHGLGLAIVKAVAKMHGGAAFANSQNGVNTFGFTLEAGSA